MRMRTICEVSGIGRRMVRIGIRCTPVGSEGGLLDVGYIYHQEPYIYIIILDYAKTLSGTTELIVHWH